MNKVRTNLVLDRDKFQALKVLAASEDVTISDLMSEGIDRIIRSRMKRNGPDRKNAQERLKSLFDRVNKRTGTFSEDDIEEDITTAIKR